MYFPIAGVTINLFLLIGVGFVVGVLGGFFGVGGGFIAGPLMFLSGVPMNYVVGTDLCIYFSVFLRSQRKESSMFRICLAMMVLALFVALAQGG